MPFAIAAIGGAAIGAIGSGLAANTQADAANNATQAQYNFYNQTRADLAPYLQSGNNALGALNQYTGVGPGGTFNPNAPGVQPFGLSQFQQSPDYQFNLQQGQMAIDKAANARGNYYAPQTLQDISKFSQGLASQEFTNAYNMYNTNQQNVWSRLQALAGGGQNAAAGLGGFGASAAQGISNTIQGAGNAQAAGIVGGANALTSGIGQGYNAYLLNQILGQQQQGSVGPYLAPLSGGATYSEPTGF